MSDRELADAVEVLPDRLYWVALSHVPKNTARSYYFSIDTQLVYEPFCNDFGPLNLSAIYRYSRLLNVLLKDNNLADKRLIHCTSHDPKKRANAVLLICAYQVIVLHKSPELALEPFNSIYPPLSAYRDALAGACTFQCTILDCLYGLDKSIQLGWFNWKKFDVDQYDFFNMVEHGDMSWIVPGKFLAFAGPFPSPTDQEGFPAFTPEDYVPIFRDASIGLVVRLNKKQYDRNRFISNGIKHVDLYFRDGSCPPKEIVHNFLHIAENEPRRLQCTARLDLAGLEHSLHYTQ